MGATIEKLAHLPLKRSITFGKILSLDSINNPYWQNFSHLFSGIRTVSDSVFKMKPKNSISVSRVKVLFSLLMKPPMAIWTAHIVHAAKGASPSGGLALRVSLSSKYRNTLCPNILT